MRQPESGGTPAGGALRSSLHAVQGKQGKQAPPLPPEQTIERIRGLLRGEKRRQAALRGSLRFALGEQGQPALRAGVP